MVVKKPGRALQQGAGEGEGAGPAADWWCEHARPWRLPLYARASLRHSLARGGECPRAMRCVCWGMWCVCVAL